MLKPLFAAATIAIVAPPLLVGEARADGWFDFGFLWPHRYRTYDSGPDYMPARRRTVDPNAAPDFYSNPPFDETYYDPAYDRSQSGPPPVNRKPVKRKTVKTGTPAAAQTSGKPASSPPVAAPGSTTASLKAPAATADTGKGDSAAAGAGKPASGNLSCDKAGKVVSDYGFADVKPASCSGKIFAFTAIRDGKPYSVKLDAVSGELTEVKKVQ